MPLASDVMKLMSHLKDAQKSCLTHFMSNDQQDSELACSFRILSECVLAQLILFNRRRQGEVSKLSITAYNSRPAQSVASEEIKKALSPMEQQLCSSFTRVEISGKRNNTVPLLITDEQKMAIDKLVDPQLRLRAGINPANIYVFATSKMSMSHLRGHDVLRCYALKCGAEDPTQLTSKRLRKHVGTVSQLLNLKDHELDQLAQFMGHDVRVHREFYRLPNDVVQTAKVAKILLAFEKGDISKYRGKSLDEIELTGDEDDGHDNAIESDTAGEVGRPGIQDSSSESEMVVEDCPVAAPTKPCKKSSRAKTICKSAGSRSKRPDTSGDESNDEEWIPEGNSNSSHSEPEGTDRELPKKPHARNAMAAHSRRKRTAFKKWSSEEKEEAKKL